MLAYANTFINTSLKENSGEAMANQLKMTDEITQELFNTAPDRLHVRRRNDEVVPYDNTKIANAIIKAFNDCPPKKINALAY